ncbi:hypothetical protein CA606_09210 [Caulobacter vibrioides]|uniref:Uncharacterized protein n=1 Tax=Caulobacter vibrioides TaxID=155892 RepID=A0A290MZ54_CAUVI|nr:hypothetical protein CA606_09210 [Caulobacter vibrioides]
MTTTAAPASPSALARMEANLQAQRVRLDQIRALEPTRRQREALGHSRIHYGASAARAFRERMRVFGLPVSEVD